jgi:WD40 repeat protein
LYACPTHLPFYFPKFGISNQRPYYRKHCLAICQTLLSEILKRFPMCSFHPPTQRFAVGTHTSGTGATATDGQLDQLDRLFITPGPQTHSIVIYDLRTASKWRVFDGHDSPVCCVSFAPSGDLLASYSAEDATARTWKSGTPGFFGSFQSIQTSHLKSIDLGAASDDASTSNSVLKNCKIDWNTSSEFKLTRENKAQASISAQ